LYSFFVTPVLADCNWEGKWLNCTSDSEPGVKTRYSAAEYFADLDGYRYWEIRNVPKLPNNMYSHDSQVTKYREVDCPNRTIKIMQFDIMGLYGDNIDKIKQDELTRIRYIIPGSIEDIVCKKYNEEHPTPKLIEKEQLKPLNVKQKVVPKR
jgi:hypothetical protein